MEANPLDSTVVASKCANVLDPFVFMSVGFLVFFVALVVIVWAFLCSWIVHVLVMLFS